MAAADFNGDGHLDIATADYGNYDGDSVSILLGNGDGTFRERVALQTPITPTYLAVGDLNHDARQDLIVLNGYPSPPLSIFLGNGDGTFEPRVDYSQFLPTVVDLDVADMNMDGHLDVVMTLGHNLNPPVWKILIWLGNGDGTLREPILHDGNGSWGLAVGDVNGDGLPDVVTTNFYASWYRGEPGAVSVMSTKPDSSFNAPVNYAVPQWPYDVILGYVNGDSLLDIVTANSRSNSLSVLLGTGNGNFGSPATLTTPGEADRIAIADVTGDGAADLVATNFGIDQVSVLPGYGDGTFATRIDISALLNPFDVIARDLNGDGRTDVAVTNAGANAISILLNTGCDPLRLAVTGVFPNRGGDAGDVEASVYGCGIQEGASVKLSRIGEPDIVGSQVTLSAEGALAAKFHLAGGAQGAWDVVVRNLDNSGGTLPGGFTIEAAREPQFWVRTLGRTRNRVGKTYLDVITAGNDGNYQFDPLAFVCIENTSCVNEGVLRWVRNGVDCTIDAAFSSPSSGLFTLPGNLPPPNSIEPIYTIGGHVDQNADCCEPECQPENSKVSTTVFQVQGSPDATGAVIADQSEGVSEGLLYRFWKQVCTAPKQRWPSRACNLPSTLRGVWGSGTSDLFAVGLRGAIVHRWPNGVWERVPSPTCMANLFGVGGRSPRDVYAVGAGGTILHFDGTAWCPQTSPTTQRLLGVWADPTGPAFAVGDGGTILRETAPGQWAVVPQLTNNILYGISGTPGGPVFAVGANGTVLRLQDYIPGTVWQAMNITGGPWAGAGTAIVSVCVVQANPIEVFAVGNSGNILHYNGNANLTWTVQTPTSQWLFGVWGSGPQDVYAVGNNSTILRFNGTNWASEAGARICGTLASQALFSIWGNSANDIWAVGSGSVGGLFHFGTDIVPTCPVSWHTHSCNDDWYVNAGFPAALNAAVTVAYNQLQAGLAPCPGRLADPATLILQAVSNALGTLQAQFPEDVLRYRTIFDDIFDIRMTVPTQAPHFTAFRNSLKSLSMDLLTCPPIRADWSISSSQEPRICAMSCDPNAKVGPAGAGANGYVPGTIPLNYAIYFENLETATLPAAEVVVTDQLDPTKLDFSTFSFGPITFGSHSVSPPPGLSRYQTDVDLRPELNLMVRIIAQLNTTTGLLTTRFLSLDPVTGLDPEDQLLGFLPPDVNSPEGEGSIRFSVLARPGLADGTVISNGASIVFDTNAPIVTNDYVNTIDSNGPSSQVVALTKVPGDEARIAAQWSGADGAGSGIGEYAIFVSDNGSPYSLWARTSAVQDTFPGEDGHTYDFYSVARDLVGNVEGAPSPLVPDATITITTNHTPAFTAVSPATTKNEGAAVSLSGSVTDADAGQTLTVTASGFPASLTLTPGSAVMPDTTSATVAGVLGAHDGDSNPSVYTIVWVASDGILSDSSSTQLTVNDAVPMAFDFTPNTLNLRSMGHWVTGYLEPPAPFTPADIDTPSVRVSTTVPVDLAGPVEIGDYDGDGIPDLMVKFNRAAVELTVSEGDSVPVTVTGTVGGQWFHGTNYIRVLRVVVSAPAAGSTQFPGTATAVRWTPPSGVNIQSVAVLSSIDDGATWDLVASGLPNSGTYNWTVPAVSADKARVAVVLVESSDETGFIVDGVLGTSDTFSILNVTGVDSGAKPGFALRAVTPNPAQQPLRVNFSLPDARPARIEVFNVLGQLAATRDVSSFGPGSHTVTLGERETLASGVYLVRLSQGGKSLTTRAVLVR